MRNHSLCENVSIIVLRLCPFSIALPVIPEVDVNFVNVSGTPKYLAT